MTHQQRAAAAIVTLDIIQHEEALSGRGLDLASEIRTALKAYARLAEANARRNHRRNGRRESAKAKAMGRTQ